MLCVAIIAAEEEEDWEQEIHSMTSATRGGRRLNGNVVTEGRRRRRWGRGRTGRDADQVRNVEPPTSSPLSLSPSLEYLRSLSNDFNCLNATQSKRRHAAARGEEGNSETLSLDLELPLAILPPPCFYSISTSRGGANVLFRFPLLFCSKDAPLQRLICQNQN